MGTDSIVKGFEIGKCIVLRCCPCRISLFTAINKMAEKYDMPVLYSCHPRSKKRLEQSGFQLDKRVIQHEPLGFHDYNCLQMHAFAVAYAAQKVQLDRR